MYAVTWCMSCQADDAWYGRAKTSWLQMEPLGEPKVGSNFDLIPRGHAPMPIGMAGLFYFEKD
jgi:hypothetical protein